MQPYLINKTYNEINIGDTASITRILTERDIALFAVTSGDINPAHVDPEFAKDAIFHKVIAHGMWGGALISAVLGTLLPGPGSIYLKQTLNFIRPVAVGDTITATVMVKKKYTVIKEKKNKKPLEKPIIELSCSCVNQHQKNVITGSAKILAPTKKIKRKPVKLPKVTLCQ